MRRAILAALVLILVAAGPVIDATAATPGETGEVGGSTVQPAGSEAPTAPTPHDDASAGVENPETGDSEADRDDAEIGETDGKTDADDESETENESDTPLSGFGATAVALALITVGVLFGRRR